VKALLRKWIVRISRARRPGLTLLLLLALIVPSACLVWFMRQAARNERLAARQKLIEAYRGHLVAARDQLNQRWRQRAEYLDALSATASPSAAFARLIRDRQAEGALVFSEAGESLYPSPAVAPLAETPPEAWVVAQQLERSDPAAAAAAYEGFARTANHDTLAAWALQAQARCLAQSGQTSAAVDILAGSLGAERFRQVLDPRGRLLQPSALLMAVDLLGDSAPTDRNAIADRLAAMLRDYDQPSMSSPQRLFLMREMVRLVPGIVLTPEFEAEDLSARFLAEMAPPRRDLGLHPAPLSGWWQFVSTRGRIITLHRESLLRRQLLADLQTPGLPGDVVLDWTVTPRQADESALISLEAGPLFPDQQIVLALRDPHFFETTSNARINAYAWTGVLVIATALALGAVALGMLRREAALAQLRSDLVANVTHELKTPLASMRLLVDTLLNAARLEENMTRDYLRLIATENLRLSRLIDNFLTFSRIERSGSTFDVREVSATMVAQQAAEAVAPRFQVPPSSFEAEIDPELPVIRVDPDAMVTALLNLLDNAWKYGGDPRRIRLRAARTGGQVRFSVSDHGPGLSPEEQERIFERFYRGDPQGPRSVSGCGLGLSIVHLVVQAHGGQVQVQSTPGQGSTFSISLPVASPEPGQPQTHAPSSEST